MIKRIDNMLSVHFPHLLGLLRCSFKCLFKWLRKKLMSCFSLIAELGFFFFFLAKFFFKRQIPIPCLQHVVTFTCRFYWLFLIRIRLAGWPQAYVLLTGIQIVSLGLTSPTWQPLWAHSGSPACLQLEQF